MKIKGVSREQIEAIAKRLGFRWENAREQGRYHLGVIRMATSRMSPCGAESPDGGVRCTRTVHRTGDHIARLPDKSIAERWPMAEGWMHAAYKYRKRGYHATVNGSEAFGGNGAVCFHGHWRFMMEIFKLNPAAIIRSREAAYLGVEDFKIKASRVEQRNVGSMMYPISYGESCDCEPGDEHEVEFGTLHPDGKLTNVRLIRQGSLRGCPFTIFNPQHYREDGTCKCNDPEHREFMKREWEYDDEAFRRVGLIP